MEGSSNVNEVIRAVLNSLFIFFFFYEKILHAPKPPKALKAPKAQRRNQAKAQNATSKQLRYGGPTTPIIVLPYIRTKNSFLGPFKSYF